MGKVDNLQRAARTIRRAVRHGGASYAGALRRYARLYRRLFSPREIEYYDLLDPALSDDALEHLVAREQLIRIDARHVVASYLCVTSDKAVFYALCLAAGIPIPRLHAVFDRPRGWTVDGRMPATREEWRDVLLALPGEFIVKPALGLQGAGVSAFRREGDAFVDDGRRRFSADELHDHLEGFARANLFAGGYSHHSLRLRGEVHKTIVQERVRVHPALEALTGSPSLSTCRIATLVQADGSASLLSTACRLVQGDAVADNFVDGTTGNLWCSVDTASGRIVAAYGLAADGRRLEKRATHAGTGADLLSFHLPRWEEAKALALRLALLFRPQALVTWDLGITDRGVVAIEGNVGGQMIPTPLNVRVDSLLAPAR